MFLQLLQLGKAGVQAPNPPPRDYATDRYAVTEAWCTGSKHSTTEQRTRNHQSTANNSQLQFSHLNHIKSTILKLQTRHTHRCSYIYCRVANLPSHQIPTLFQVARAMSMVPGALPTQPLCSYVSSQVWQLYS